MKSLIVCGIVDYLIMLAYFATNFSAVCIILGILMMIPSAVSVYKVIKQ